MQTDLKIGIIGGSGMEDPAFISDYSKETISTPYGSPSSELILGNIFFFSEESNLLIDWPIELCAQIFFIFTFGCLTRSLISSMPI